MRPKIMHLAIIVVCIVLLGAAGFLFLKKNSQSGPVLFALFHIVGVPYEPTAEPPKTLIQAVENRNTEAALTFIEKGTDLEASGNDGFTALLTAVASDQYDIAIHLIDAGANVFATTPSGATAGLFLQSGAIDRLQGLEDPRAIEMLDEALVVKAKLEERGFPFPPPEAAEVRELIRQGMWPPR